MAVGQGPAGAAAHREGRVIPLELALHAATRAPFEAMGQEGGELHAGGAGDWILLDRSLEELSSPGGMVGVQVLVTCVGGRVVHAQGPFAGLAGESVDEAVC